MPQATHSKTREEVFSAQQIHNFKGIKGKTSPASAIISEEFSAPLVRSSTRSPSPTGCEWRSHELSQFFAEGSHYQNLFTTSTSGASENSSDIQQLRHEREQFTVHCCNLETETLRCQSAGSSLFTPFPGLRGMVEFEAWLGFGNISIWRMNFRCDVSSCASRPSAAMVWINGIESAKSVADLETSKYNHRVELQSNFETLGSKERVVSRRSSTQTAKEQKMMPSKNVFSREGKSHE